MTLRWRLSALISLLLALVLAGGLASLQFWATRQAERRGRELVLAASRRIQTGAGDSIPLRRLIQEEQKISLVPLSIALYEGGQMVELVGHEPPLNDANWQTTEFTLHGRRVVLGFPFYQTREALNRQATFLALLGAVLWLFLSGTTGWVVAATLRPIQSLAHQAVEAAREAGPTRLHTPSQDGELVHLVETLNGLLAQIHRRSAQREQFHVAVSHELRTPLQALLGHLEVALLRDRTLEEYREVLQECTHQTQRLTQLIEALLLLNRLDYAPIAEETVDLLDLLPGNAYLETELEQVTVKAPQPLLEVLLRNLWSNADRHRTPGSQILVRLDEDCLRVENARDSQEVLDSHRLREPFYRPFPSASFGNGLGLALASAVADRLGWQLELQAPPGRFVATVRWKSQEVPK